MQRQENTYYLVWTDFIVYNFLINLKQIFVAYRNTITNVNTQEQSKLNKLY